MLAPSSPLVACVGDSMTRGDAAHEPGNGTHWPFKTVRRMRNRGNWPLLLSASLAPRFTVRNFGHGGRTAVNMSDGYVRTPEYAAALETHPRVVVLMLGTNDCKARVWKPPRSADPLDTPFAGALEKIGQSFLRLPSRPSLVLLVPPPVVRLPHAHDVTSGLFRADVLAAGVADSIKAVARRLGAAVPAARTPCTPGAVTLADLHSRWQTRYHCTTTPTPSSLCASLFAEDGIHTTARGAEAIAEAVREVLQQCAAEELIPAPPWS